jgi:sugar phosphate isomerase/epimerase
METTDLRTTQRGVKIALAQQAWPFAGSPLAGLFDFCEWKRLPRRADVPDEGMPALLHLQWQEVDGALTILNLGSAGFSALLDESGVVETARWLRPRWISLHLGFSADRIIALGQGRPAQAQGPILPRAVVRQRMVENLAQVQSRLPAVPLLLENLDYMPPAVSGAYEHVCEPEFIAEVLAATGAGMLLDLAHAQVSAGNLGRPLDAYLEALPLAAVRQVHLSRPERQAEGWNDSHLAIMEADVARLEELLPRLPRCEVVTLETFGEVGEIEAQLERLQRVRSPQGGAG